MCSTLVLVLCAALVLLLVLPVPTRSIEYFVYERDKGWQAKERFCNTPNLIGFTFTGYWYEAFSIGGDQWLGRWASLSRVHRFRSDIDRMQFVDHTVQEVQYGNDQFREFVAFTGVHLPISEHKQIYLEFYRKTQINTRVSDYAKNQVAYCPFHSADKPNAQQYKQNIYLAMTNLWDMCDFNVLTHNGTCLNTNGGIVYNKLFNHAMVNFTAVEEHPYFGLIYIRQVKLLIWMKNLPDRTIDYRWVNITDTSSCLKDSWSETQNLDIGARLVGAFEYYSRYYFVLKKWHNHSYQLENNTALGNEPLYLRELDNAWTVPPIKLNPKEIDYKEFFQCHARWTDYFGSVLFGSYFATIIVFCCVARIVGKYRRENKPAEGRDLPPNFRVVPREEIPSIASQYLVVSKGGQVYTDDDRRKRDNDALITVALEDAKQALQVDSDGLREKLKKRKRKKK